MNKINHEDNLKELKEVFSSRIKSLRKRRKLTQEELSFLLDISRTYLASLESGKMLPSMKVLVRIVNFFNCSYDYLLSKNNFPEKYKPVSDNLFEIIKNSNDARFDDYEITEKEKDTIIAAIKHALSIVKLTEKK